MRDVENNNIKNIKKVMVGMSGGVDSSVSAMILKNSGYEVMGVTLKLFSDDDIAGEGSNDSCKTCCSLDDVLDARQIARKLGFEHVVFNFKDDFREKVMCHFADSYIRGRTPNPCIECNRHMKFDKMLRRADELGYDYIATGHYAVIEFDKKSGRYLLKKPKDLSKDQTYVLYMLTQEQLARTIFPLGNLEKSQVRELAESAGFVNSKKPDSQDICFVPDGNYSEFIKKFTGADVPCGDFVNMQGEKIGTHSGIINYTIGQRKHLGIALGYPAYVVKKDVEKNTVTIGVESDLYTKSLTATDVNLIAVPEIVEPLRVSARTRYNQTEQPALLSYMGDGRYLVEFDRPQRAVTSGQAVVFYDGDTVVGGGTIE